MRGTKAKLLRGLAGHKCKNPETKYAVKPNSERKHIIPKIVDGEMVLDVMTGEPVALGYYTTTTLVLNKCSRQLYQMLKGQFAEFNHASRG